MVLSIALALSSLVSGRKITWKLDKILRISELAYSSEEVIGSPSPLALVVQGWRN